MQTSGGTLVNLAATDAVISRMSIVSRVTGTLSLLESANSSIMVEKCAFSGLASYFGHFSGGSVAVTSSSFADTARPLTFDGVLSGGSLLECERRWVGYNDMNLDNIVFDGCNGDPSNVAAGGAVYFEKKGTTPGRVPTLSITNCQFKNCRARNPIYRLLGRFYTHWE